MLSVSSPKIPDPKSEMFSVLRLYHENILQLISYERLQSKHGGSTRSVPNHEKYYMKFTSGFVYKVYMQ